MAATRPLSVEITVDSDSGGRTATLGAPARSLYLIGRHSTCDVVVPMLPQHGMVGRFHAAIEVRPEGVFVINLHANKTYINDRVVVDDKREPLPEQAQLRLGNEGPVLSVRWAPAKVVIDERTPLPPPAAGPSEAVQETLSNFGKHLLALYTSMQEAQESGAAVSAQEVTEGLEVVVTRLRGLRAALGIQR